MITLVENNHYAISVPLEKQMPVPDVAERGAAYGMPGVMYDGNDLLLSYNVAREAVLRARRGEGPTLLEAKTYRPTPHSSDDDDRSYRSREEVEMWKKRDPISCYEKVLREKGVLTDTLAERILNRVMGQVDDATEYAQRAPYPRAEDALHPVFGEKREWQPAPAPAMLEGAARGY
jgi:2-oxoisovalerate dehydrogenase E1 component alpha subunit